MSRARQRRIQARQIYLARLAASDPIKFDAELRSRLKGWMQTIRDRADDLSADASHKIADKAVGEMRELAASSPSTVAAAANVAAVVRHTAMAEVARVVEPRMAVLSIWPEEKK